MTRFSLFVGMWLALASTSAGALSLAQLPIDAVVIDDVASESIANGASNVQIKAVKSLLAKGEMSASFSLLGAIEDVVAFEAAAVSFIQGVEGMRDSRAARSALESLATVPTRVFKRHEETRGDWFVPAFNVGASARYALRGFEERAQREAWSARFNADELAALAALVNSDAATLARASAAISDLATTAFYRLEKAALANPRSVQSALWRALAERSSEARIFYAAARFSTDLELLQLIPASRRLKSSDTETWLLMLLSRPQTASASLLALAPLATDGSRALEAIIARLDDAKMGSSSAAALVARPHGDSLAIIRGMLGAEDMTPRRLQSIALALRLDDSGPAQSLIETLSRDERLSAEFRAELFQ